MVLYEMWRRAVQGDCVYGQPGDQALLSLQRGDLRERKAANRRDSTRAATRARRCAVSAVNRRRCPLSTVRVFSVPGTRDQSAGWQSPGTIPCMYRLRMGGEVHGNIVEAHRKT